MKNLEIYDKEVFKNRQLSVEKLKEVFLEYQARIAEAEQDARATGLTGDDLADKFFNNVDEQAILSFETDSKQVQLLLGRVHIFDDETETSEFEACYTIEERNLDEELEDMEDFEEGQEEALIQALKNLGYQE